MTLTDKALIKEAIMELLPEFVSEFMAIQREKEREEELITFRQAEKEYKLSYSNLMNLKARKFLIVTYKEGHPYITRKEAKRQVTLKGKHNKSI